MTVEHALTRLQLCVETFAQSLSQLQYLQSQLTSSAQLLQEELRVHYIAEVLCFFPTGMLRGLQCQLCRHDTYCWKGKVQGIACGLYFLSHHPDPSVRERFSRLSHLLTQERSRILATVHTLPFLDLLALCHLTQANIRLLSLVTNIGVRSLLFTLLLKEYSPTNLTEE